MIPNWWTLILGEQKYDNIIMVKILFSEDGQAKNLRLKATTK